MKALKEHIDLRTEGLPFKHYLNELRVLYDKDMLLTTDMNITVVAYSSWFSSTSYFNRTFKK